MIGNPVIVMIIMGVLGYRRRTGFLAGLTVAQISEFSLILPGAAATLERAGADMILLPFVDAAKEAVDRLVEVEASPGRRSDTIKSVLISSN